MGGRGASSRLANKELKHKLKSANEIVEYARNNGIFVANDLIDMAQDNPNTIPVLSKMLEYAVDITKDISHPGYKFVKSIGIDTTAGNRDLFAMSVNPTVARLYVAPRIAKMSLKEVNALIKHNYKQGFLGVSTFKGAIAHEIGHSVYNHLGTFEKTRVSLKAHDRTIQTMKKHSKYANQDNREAFAEAFASIYTNNRPKSGRTYLNQVTFEVNKSGILKKKLDYSHTSGLISSKKKYK